VGRSVPRFAHGIRCPTPMAKTGTSRHWVYYRLREIARWGRVVQTEQPSDAPLTPGKR